MMDVVTLVREYISGWANGGEASWYVCLSKILVATFEQDAKKSAMTLERFAWWDEQMARFGGFALYRDELAVLCVAHSAHQSRKVDAVAVKVIDLHVALVELIFVDRRQDFLGKFERYVDANDFVFGIGVVHADVEPAVAQGCVG